MKEYKKIEFWGNNIDQAVQELLKYKEKGILVCCDFNGVMLYSDTVTLDSAYIQITGQTKAEREEAHRKWKENYNKEEKEFKERIPQLTEMWKEKGHKILNKDKWNYWDEIVPIRLGDLYHGMELGNCLDIVKILNNGTFDEAKQLLNEQGHSGMSYGLVCAMIREFSDKGEEFVNYIK